jgi:hypothetical protein
MCIDPPFVVLPWIFFVLRVFVNVSRCFARNVCYAFTMIDAEKIEVLREEQRKLRREVMDRTVTAVTAAMGLVIGLSWSDVVNAFVKTAFPLSQDTLGAKVIYAAILTVALVSATILLVRFTQKKD